jgi:hypothetical protein
MTKEEAWKFARGWIAAWNAHDLESILAHYDDAVELTSPVAIEVLGAPDGGVSGKTNLKTYFERGLEVHAGLRFHLEDVLWGLNSIVLYYRNQKGSHTAEFMEFSRSGRVARVVANYNA